MLSIICRDPFCISIDTIIIHSCILLCNHYKSSTNWYLHNKCIRHSFLLSHRTCVILLYINDQKIWNNSRHPMDYFKNLRIPFQNFVRFIKFSFSPLLWDLSKHQCINNECIQCQVLSILSFLKEKHYFVSHLRSESLIQVRIFSSKH